jgi:hypothetical protein
MLRHELNGMIHVPCLKHENGLFLGFRIGTVGRRDFAVLPIQGQRGFRRLKSFSRTKVPVGAQMVVLLKAFGEHCVLLLLGHAREFSWLDVSQTDVFHGTSSLVGGQQRNLARRIVHPIVVGRRENRQQSQFFISIPAAAPRGNGAPGPAEPTTRIVGWVVGWE